MVVHLKPQRESFFKNSTTGRAPEELVEDAMSGYLAELTQAWDILDGRYDEMNSGRVLPDDGEQAFVQLKKKIQNHFDMRYSLFSLTLFYTYTIKMRQTLQEVCQKRTLTHIIPKSILQ